MAFVKTNDQTSGVLGTTSPRTTAAFANPLTNPSLIVVFYISNPSATGPGTPTDTAGNTYVDSGAGLVLGGTFCCKIFYALNTATTASNVISETFNTGLGRAASITAVEFTGGATASPVRAFATNPSATASGTAVTSTAIAGTVAGDLIVGLAMDAGSTLTVGAGFTQTSDGGRPHSSEYNLSGAGGSIAATWTTSISGESYCAMAVAFKPPAAANTDPPFGSNVQPTMAPNFVQSIVSV